MGFSGGNVYVELAAEQWELTGPPVAGAAPPPPGELAVRVITSTVRPEQDGWVACSAWWTPGGEPAPTLLGLRVRASAIPGTEPGR